MNKNEAQSCEKLAKTEVAHITPVTQASPDYPKEQQFVMQTIQIFNLPNGFDLSLLSTGPSIRCS